MERELFMKPWHELPFDQAARLLDTNPTAGLTHAEVSRRRKEAGLNKLPQEALPSRLRVFLRQFLSPLIFILVIAGVITPVLGEYTEAIVIWGAVLLNASIGFLQEWKATNALAKLRSLVQAHAIVVREGAEEQVLQEELVPGDILVLQPGFKVPADSRIFQASSLKIGEAILTGEWMPSEKHARPLPAETQLADRENMAYMGSSVEDGWGKAVAVATGGETEIGKVASLVGSIEEVKTPYQRRLAQFAKAIGVLVAFLATFIFLEGMITGGTFATMFTTAVAVAVGAVPEGLPIAVTVILAIGMQRILQKKGLVRKMASAETLGSASVIATDKTLTLTEGRMQVDAVFVLDPEKEADLWEAAVSANEAREEEGELRGRPTDKALLAAAKKKGIVQHGRLAFLPFRTETKFLASLQAEGTLFVAGAPETLFNRSVMKRAERSAAEEKLREFAASGLRVVAFAKKKVPQSKLKTPDGHLDQLADGMEFLGLVALKDPVRKGAAQAIRQAQRAGIRVVMITGDHALTAQAVAKAIGLPAESNHTLEGKDLDQMSDEVLQSRIEEISVFARTEPVHKMRIIQAWQNKGQVVAMTGDGVNDAPALKKADIGIALGSGTDIAKEVADLVLLGDNFAIIPAAIREGRLIVSNVRKVITYLVSGSFTETILIGVSIMLGWPLPLLAVQILWVNLVEGSLPALALSFEHEDGDVMRKKPEEKKVPLLTREMKVIIFGIGILTDLLLLGLFAWFFLNSSYAIEHIRTLIFGGLAISALLYVFSCKNLERNIWQYNIFSNKYLILAVLAGFLLLAAAIYVPLLQVLFETVPLGVFDWALLLSVGLVNVMLIEMVKWYYNRT